MFEESPRGETVNHVEENKRNLKNFFKDRIPEDRQLRATPKAASGLIRSEKLYEIKCTQDDLKNQTKMSLKNSFKMDPAKRQSIGKISEIFYAKGPAEDLKRKLKTNDQRSYSFYDDLNHQRGTISHI